MTRKRCCESEISGILSFLLHGLILGRNQPGLCKSRKETFKLMFCNVLSGDYECFFLMFIMRITNVSHGDYEIMQ